MASRSELHKLMAALRHMVTTLKHQLFAEFNQELAIAHCELAELVEKAMSTKEEQISALELELETSNQSLEVHKLLQSLQVRSLLCLKYKRNTTVRPGSVGTLGYIQSCTAAPEDLSFVEDYPSMKFQKNKHHQVYYQCRLGHDPYLISFIAVAIRDELNEELNVSIQDLMNGVYSVDFVAAREGVYSVQVALYGQDIPGSPFQIKIADLVTPESKPPLSEWGQPEAEDGASGTRAATRKSPRCGVREDGHARRPEEPPPRPFTQAAKPLALPVKHAVREDSPPELPHVAASVNIPPNAVSPQEKSVGGFPTALTGPLTPKPLEQIASSGARPKWKAPFPKAAGVSSSSSSFEMDQFCSDERFASHEREEGPLGHSDSLIRSTSAVKFSALPGDSMPEADSPKPETQPAARAPTKKGTFIAELISDLPGSRGRRRFSFAIGVTATVQDVVILTETGTHCVQMFDAEARYLGPVCLPASLGGFKRPSAVVAQEDGTFAVKDDRCIYIFSKQGKFIRTLGKGSLSRPYGLALHRGENLLTLSLGDRTPTLRHFSMTGNFEKSVAYGPLWPSVPHGSKCRFMDVHDDDLFVSDLGTWDTCWHCER